MPSVKFQDEILSLMRDLLCTVPGTVDPSVDQDICIVCLTINLCILI